MNLEKLKTGLLLTIICIVGSLLRFFNLGRIIFYWDEPYHTVKIAAQSFSYAVSNDFGSVFYQLLLHFILPLGKPEFISRLPAAIFGILTIIVTYYVGKLLVGKTEGIIAALLVTFSSYLISFSQYARGYSGLTLFSLLSLYFFYRALKENKVVFWSLYIIFSVLNIYTHFFALITVFIYLSFGAILLLEKLIGTKFRKSWSIDKKRFISFSISTFLLLLFVFLLRSPVKLGGVNVVNWLINTVARFSNAKTIGFFPLIYKILNAQIAHFPSLFFVISICFIILGIISCLVKLRKEYVLILIYVFLPLVGFVLIKPRMVFVISADRYFIFLLPFLFLLLAKGITYFSSVINSLISRFNLIKKREHFYRNSLLTILIFSLFLIEAFNIKEYYLYFWRLGSLNLNDKVKQLLTDKVNTIEMIFFDFRPNKGEPILVSPLYLRQKEKKILIYKINKFNLEEISYQKLGLWVIIDSSLLRDKNLSSKLPGKLEGTVDEYYMIHLEAGKQPLIKNLIKMTQFLIPLRPDREVEYRLLLTKFYLMDNNMNQASHEVETIKKMQFSQPEEREYIKESTWIFNIMDTFLNIDSNEYSNIIQNSVSSEIGRLFFIQGNRLLRAKKWDEAGYAYDQSIRFTDLYIPGVSHKYVKLGRQFLQRGKIDESISQFQKAIKFNPDDYSIYFFLGEAYRKKGIGYTSVSAYRNAFSLPSVSNNLLFKIISSPQVFVIWRKEKRWYFMWRTNRECNFSGKVQFSKGIAKIKKYHFSPKEILNQHTKNEVEFMITTKNRLTIKILEIETNKKAHLTCYLGNGDQITTDKIIFLNTGKNPKKIPFSFP